MTFQQALDYATKLARRLTQLAPCNIPERKTNMTELRVSIIKNDTDPTKDKRVEIHVTDADTFLDKIKSTQGHPFQPAAGELKDLVATVLAKCGDTDKIEIGPDGAFHCNVGGKTPIAL